MAMNDIAFLDYNGKIHSSTDPIINAGNRSFRYGDGFFETMKMINGKIVFSSLHFERLFSSLQTLQFDTPEYLTPSYLEDRITKLAIKNSHTKLARIRLTIFRGNGELNDTPGNSPGCIIQTWSLNATSNTINEYGSVIDIFKDAKIACDKFSHIKSNNYLPYIMGSLWAKKNALNDALMLNSSDRITEATIANIFIVKENIIKTPSLSEGCVSGIIRKHLLGCLAKDNITIEETELTIEDVLTASEVFLTNSIFGIKWVKQIREVYYNSNAIAASLHKKYLLPFLDL